MVGSGLHLGSSITFRNTFGQRASDQDAPSNVTAAAAAEHHELFVDNSSGPRRSCSITLAYPSDCAVLPTDNHQSTHLVAQQSTATSPQSSRVTLNQPASLVTRQRQDRGYVMSCSGRLMSLAPPVITYDARTSMPPPPSQQTNYQIQSPRSRSVLVTPRGSFLAVNQSPIEFRESMLSIGYPNYSGCLLNG